MASRPDHDSVPVSSQDKKPDHLSSAVATTQKGLSLVLLLSENIPATHKKHAWETGKPKNVDIRRSWQLSSMRILFTLLSQSNIVHTTGPSPSATERPKRRRRLPRSRKSTARMIANCDLRRTQDITRDSCSYVLLLVDVGKVVAGHTNTNGKFWCCRTFFLRLFQPVCATLALFPRHFSVAHIDNKAARNTSEGFGLRPRPLVDLIG